MARFTLVKTGLGALAVWALAVCLLPGDASAQQHTTFCLEGGLQVSVDRFEVRDGKFLLYVAGSSAPMEYASSAVKGINVPCQTTPATTPTAPQPTTVQAAPGEFGIHGSNTIGERLMPMLIEAYAEKKFGKKPQTKLLGSEEQEFNLGTPSGAHALVTLLAHGSGTATPGLVSGKAVIGMASRRLNTDETKAIDDKYKVNILAAGNEHVLALDGLAVIVNPANPVKQLSLEQIAKIFSGDISNWHEVGGDDQPINLYRRDDKSGTFDTFKSLVLGPFKLKVAGQAKAYESSESLSVDVERDPKGIGFIGLPYIGKNTALGISSSCGIASVPSKFSIKTEEYPLARRLYLYTIGVPSDATAHDLLEFALSDDAQPIVKEAEFVDQAVDFEDGAAQSNWVKDAVDDPSRTLGPDKPVPGRELDAFGRAMDKTHRTSIVFRFEKGSAQLDNRALQDTARLARYLNAPAQAGKRFVIAGFADSTGSWGSNKHLASERAAAVVNELQKAGLRVPRDSVVSFSYMAPVACNDSDVGAAKNRRVEVWIAR